MLYPWKLPNARSPPKDAADSKREDGILAALLWPQQLEFRARLARGHWQILEWMHEVTKRERSEPGRRRPRLVARDEMAPSGWINAQQDGEDKRPVGSIGAPKRLTVRVLSAVYRRCEATHAVGSRRRRAHRRRVIRPSSGRAASGYCIPWRCGNWRTLHNCSRSWLWPAGLGSKVWACGSGRRRFIRSRRCTGSRSR